MFEVLVFVYENYWRGNACPELAHLERKLNAAGFDTEEVQDALNWLNDLNRAACGLQRSVPESSNATQFTDMLLTQSPYSMRIYSPAEQKHLGAQCLGFVCFLETVGVLPTQLREIVLERAMAAPGHPVSLDDFKIIVLMVYWSLGEGPDMLILDELCDDSVHRLAH
jgi:Smg protein